MKRRKGKETMQMNQQMVKMKTMHSGKTTTTIIPLDTIGSGGMTPTVNHITIETAGQVVIFWPVILASQLNVATITGSSLLLVIF